MVTAHVGAAFGIEAEVIVVDSMPDSRSADVFVVVGELPIAFLPGVAEGNAKIIGLIAGGQGMGARVVCVFGAKSYREWPVEHREGGEIAGHFAANDDRIEVLRARPERGGAVLVYE